ncbi:MAG TPA: tetratricopeptide repeat protein [Phycisphaerae bacterium]|nr:tetratricopeptide repeat protein [Phycisphaerae bacterium]
MDDPSARELRHPAQPLPAETLPQPRTGRPWITLGFLCLIVSAVLVAAHWPVLSTQALSFDDDEAIIQNHLIQDPGWHSLVRFFSEVRSSSVISGYYRPLTLVSLMIDWAMGARPDDLRVFHRTSLILHVLSTVLLILLCHQLFGQPVVAAMVGLLFGLHPLTVEPIAWVMERKTILAAVFCFASINAYVRFARTGNRSWHTAALAMFLLALLAKPTSAPLPIFLLLVDRWPLNRLNRRALIEKIPFLALSALFAAITIISEQSVNPLNLPAAESPLHLPLRICWLIVFYPAKILLPIRLSSAYVLPNPFVLSNPIVLAAVAGTFTLIAALVLSARRTPAFWVGATLFYVGLAPTMGIVGYSWVVASDKYAYIPAVGPVLVLAWLLGNVWSGTTGRAASVAKVMILAAVLSAAVFLTIGTRHYLKAWRTTASLFNHMLALTPDFPDLYLSRGGDLLNRGLTEQAMADFEKALELDPNNAAARRARGQVLVAMGQDRQAVQEFSRAIELEPRYASAYLDRAEALRGLSQFDEALRDYDRAIKLKPRFAAAFLSRGNLLSSLQRYREAIGDYDKAIELKPNHADARCNRGACFIAIGEPAGALSDLNRAIALKPENPEFHLNRGSAHVALGAYLQALDDYNTAIRLDSHLASAYQGRALVYWKLGELGKARTDLEASRRLGAAPDDRLMQAIGATSQPAD